MCGAWRGMALGCRAVRSPAFLRCSSVKLWNAVNSKYRARFEQGLRAITAIALALAFGLVTSSMRRCGRLPPLEMEAALPAVGGVACFCGDVMWAG